jgi:HAD superfamily hydrolase (TIGR01509 family)
MIEAILWDNDGVLVDTEHLFFEATRETLEGFGVSLAMEQYKSLTLDSGRSCFDLAADRGASREEILRARAARDVVYQARLEEGVELIDGVEETLAQLHGVLPMAIVTSCDPQHFDTIHAGLPIRDYFEFAITPAHYERYKPHPEPYLTAANRLGLAPECCLVVEDTARGLAAACAAGMRCVIIPNALTHDSDFADALQVLVSIHEVPSLLESLRAD